MSKPTQKRQGDIFFETCDKSAIPKSAKPAPGRRVLFHGEVTGHSHAIENDVDLSKVEVLVDTDGSMFVVNNSDVDVPVSHDEHDTITLSPGEVWHVTRQREYDPFAEHERYVAD